jgi:hypothetical protein
VAVQVERPRPWWRRWLRRVVVTLLLVLVGLGGRLYYRHHQAVTKLEEALAALDHDDPGWRLEDIEAARGQIPKDENSARVVVTAAKLLPQRWPPQEFDDPLGGLAPEEQLAPDALARLKQELDKVRPALEEARKLAAMPRGRYHVVYERNVLETRLGDQAEARRVAILLAYDALRRGQDGDDKRALASCRAALNAARSLGDEPITMSQLIRIAGVVIACQATERALAQGEPPPDELESLQRAVETEDAHPGLLITLRGERAMSDALFRAIEDGDVAVNGLAGVKWDWPQSALVSVWRLDTHADHALLLSLLTRRIAEVRLPMHEQSGAERQLEQELRHLPRKAVLTGLLMPAMSKLGAASRRKHAHVRCLAAALAAERYRREHGAWPESLEKLVPGHLAEVPLDPFDGLPLRYRRLADGVMIYSVGQDGIDNGGNLDREHANQPGVDVGVRLWDVKHRRQPPRPKEKAPEGPDAPGGPPP